jgi:hypothetical protein
MPSVRLSNGFCISEDADSSVVAVSLEAVRKMNFGFPNEAKTRCTMKKEEEDTY